MVAILLSVFFSSGLHAQNFTYTSNAEYGKITVSSVPQLMQYKVADATRFTTTDPTIDLTMDCLAANGYGQWTCSSAIGTLAEPTTDQWLFSPNQSTVNPSVPTNWDITSTSTHLKGWFLLDNLLAKPSEQFVSGTRPGCQPPGIVSGGEFNTTYPTAPKVVANLNGRVRYVWVEPTARLTFKLEGFNDAVGATVPERQIDIQLNSASSLLPNGISSNSPLNRQIIKQIIANYPTGGGDITTIDVGGINSHMVANETAIGGSGFHSDEFDIAIDQKFLYIVWNSGGSIWAKAMFLSNGNTATTAFQVSASGTRPTIACDVRNNPTNPQFTASFLNAGIVSVGEFIGNAIQHGGFEILQNKYNDPQTVGLIDNYICGATHARVLVSSGGTATMTSVYVRECDELILFKGLTWVSASDFGWYVDGVRVYHGAGSDPLPSPILQGTVGHYNSAGRVVDKPIIAFANPYDNQTGIYNQYHCLYQLQVLIDGVNTENPLILIRGADNNFGNSTGNIENNNITEDLFAAGIRILSNNGNMTHSYLCNNTLTDLNGLSLGSSASGSGIQSDHYDGYVNLCSMSNCGYGYSSESNDQPFIIHSSMINSKLSGIFIDGGSTSDFATVDLTGIHSPTSCTTCYDFAANNNISNNGSNSSDAQILLIDQHQKCKMGDQSGGLWGSWGRNKVKNKTSTLKLIATSGTPIGNVGSIDKNRWENSTGVTIDPFPPPSANFSVTYAATSGQALGSWTDSSSFFSCSGYSGSQRIVSKGSSPLSFPIWTDTCAHLKTWAAVNPGNEEDAKKEYDTLRIFIEHCALSDTTAWEVFHNIVSSVQYMSNDSARFDQFRSWLISVLYLNKVQPEYFCACMGAIASTYQYGKFTPLGFLAVYNYLRTRHRECWSANDDREYAKDSAYDARSGHQDDVSHLPSLDSMGLGFLLDHNLAGQSPISISSQYLSSFTSSPNPFIKETTLEFTLNRMTYVEVAVYDELGKLVWGDSHGSTLEAGTHQIHLDGSAFPNGVFYARISTGFGEVKTVKLVKEF